MPDKQQDAVDIGYVDIAALKAQMFRKDHPEFNDGLDIVRWYEKCVDEAPVIQFLMVDDSWIPCTKRLPTELDSYTVTMQVTSESAQPKTWRRVIEMTFDPARGTDGWIYPAAYHKLKVIAWQEKIKPYAGEE